MTNQDRGLFPRIGEYQREIKQSLIETNGLLLGQFMIVHENCGTKPIRLQTNTTGGEVVSITFAQQCRAHHVRSASWVEKR